MATTDKALVTRLTEILKSSDLDTTTATCIRRRLEEEFAVDYLNRQKELIRQQIEVFLEGLTAKNDLVVVEQREGQEREVNKDSENGFVLEQEGEESEEKIEEEEEEEHRRKRKKGESADIGPDLKKKWPAGFNRHCGLSPELQKLLGVPELPRTEVVKRIWAYIKERNLQNPKDKRKIICDESLRRIFRVKSIDMFEMNKALSEHIWSLNEATAIKSPRKERQHKQHNEVATNTNSSQKERQRKQRKEVGSDEPEKKVKPERPTASNITAPVPLSDALIEFFGTGERELPRAHVVKKIWQYIKEKELQDPSDRKTVLCDDKLKELFKVDSFVGFRVTKLLTSHIIKPKQ